MPVREPVWFSSCWAGERSLDGCQISESCGAEGQNETWGKGFLLFWVISRGLG